MKRFLLAYLALVALAWGWALPLPGPGATPLSAWAVREHALTLTGLWAFASQYCVYSPDRGHPLQLAGHGDQGVFNAIASMLHKSDNFHILPETEWCDSTVGCALGIQEMSGNGELVVSNVTTGNKQRIVHSSGPKWWTKAGEVHQGRRGDKLKVFEHFYNFSRKGL